MEVYPPISKRSTKQLLEIIETSDKWRPDVLKMAQEELVKRGISIKEQKNRRASLLNFIRRTKNIKENTSYSFLEKVFIILIGPFLIALFTNIFLFHSKGYKKKNRQATLCLLIGFILWASVIILYINRLN